MTNDKPIAKKDVEEIVGRVVGSIMSDALDTISAQLGKSEQRLGQKIEGVEQKLA